MPQTAPRLLQFDDNPLQNQPEIDRRFCTETVLTLSPLQEPGSPSIHPSLSPCPDRSQYQKWSTYQLVLSCLSLPVM